MIINVRENSVELSHEISRIYSMYNSLLNPINMERLSFVNQTIVSKNNKKQRKPKSIFQSPLEYHQ